DIPDAPSLVLPSTQDVAAIRAATNDHPSRGGRVMNADVNLSPINLDAAWTARTLHDDPRWIIELSDADNTELKEALAYAKSRKRRVPELSREDFPLPRLAARLEQVRKELTHGRAVVLIRGLPVAELGKEDAGTIFWGIGTYLGTAS